MCTPPWTKCPEGVSYIICQHEKGETDHLQGFIQLYKAQRLTWLKNRVNPKAHWEPMKCQDTNAARHYCMKPVDCCLCEHCKSERIKPTKIAGPWVFGKYVRTCSTNMGGGRRKRTDIELYRDAIRAGTSIDELYDMFPSQMARYPKMFTDLHQPDISRKPPKVILIVGDTGRFKTKWFFDNCNHNSWWQSPISNGTTWMDGYKNQKWVLFDDFTGQLALDQFLRLADRYPIMVPVKGSHVEFNPEVVVFTSNRRPRDWYKWRGRENKYTALCRRFTDVFDFNNGEIGADIESLRVTGCELRNGKWELGKWFGDFEPPSTGTDGYVGGMGAFNRRFQRH